MTCDTIYVLFHREERGDMMTDDRSDMMMMMVVPTHILLTRDKSYLWILFTFSD